MCFIGIISSSADSTIRLWDVPSPAKDEPLEIKEGPVLSHTISAEGENVITSIDWNVSVYCLPHIQSDGTELLTASYDGEVKLWRDGGSSCMSLCTHKAPVFNASFSPSSSRILVTGALPSFYVYSLTPEGVDQEYDVVTINDRDRQIGSEQVLNSNRRFYSGMSLIVVILDSHWRDDSYFTFIDNLNRIVNVNLSPLSNQTHLHILCGHDVIVLNSSHY